MPLCIECNEREVLIKKRKLCRLCYMRLYMQGKIQKDNEITHLKKAIQELIKIQDPSETVIQVVDMLEEEKQNAL